MAYWSVRALNPSAKDHRALRKARSMYSDLNLSDATIRKCAQKYRNVALNFLKLGGRIKDPRIEGRVLHMRTREQIEALREYLRKKSARVDE